MRSTVAAMALVLLAVAPAMAGAPKVALTAIENDDGDLREAVVEALEGPELSLVSSKATNRAVDSLKGELSDLTEKQAKKLSSELEADAIVFGTFQKTDGKKFLKFKLFVNGKKMRGFSVQFSNPRSKLFKKRLKDHLVEKLGSGPAGGDDEVKKPKGSKAAPADDDEDPIANKKGGKKGKKGDKADKADKTEKVAKADKPKKGEKADKSEKADKADDKDEVADKADKTEKTEKTDKDEASDEDEDKPRKAKKRTAKVDDEDGEVSVRAKASSGSAGVRSANRVAVRLDVGASASARRLSFTSTPELGNVNGVDQRPKGLKQNPVPGARFGVEVYPLAFGNPTGAAAGLGAVVEYDKVLKSQTTVKGGEDDGVQSPVTQQTYELGLRYRIAFGRSATSPTVTLGANYGRRTFKVQGGNLTMRSNLDLPDTDYKYIAPTLGFRIPFTANIAFVADGEGLLVRDAGRISDADQYGKAKVFGIGGAAGLDVVIGNRFAIRVVGELTQIGFTFTGGGELAKDRDGDPTTRDIGGALDRSFGGSATLGVLY